MFSQRFIYTTMRREQSECGGVDGCVILQQPCGVIATAAGNRWFGGYKFHVTQLTLFLPAKKVTLKTTHGQNQPMHK